MTNAGEILPDTSILLEILSEIYCSWKYSKKLRFFQPGLGTSSRYLEKTRIFLIIGKLFNKLKFMVEKYKNMSFEIKGELWMV